MADINYLDRYYEVIDARRASGSIKNEDKYTPYDYLFTSVNYITNNFLALTPTDKEIREFFNAKGFKIEDVLIEDYLDAFRQLILQRVIESSASTFRMNMNVRCALNRRI